ncbi:hypothetical protein ACFQLX_18195 [Streptomyces polyrhachis]|uniref:Integral membrane protein n=1 Tax=Streptomyces polyrhachis TaxID=1282885 RepID=A0ABW2GKR3_9ACTN
MNIRSLTRGDGVVIGAALLLFVASLLNFYVADCPSGMSGDQCANLNDKAPSGWSGDLFTAVTAIYLSGLIAAVLLVVGRLLPEGRKPAGLALDQVGVGLAASALLSTLAGLINTPEGDFSPGMGLYLALLSTLLLVAGAVLGSVAPAFKAPLLPEPRPAQPQPYGGQPQQGYGYPGAPQPYGQQAPAGYGQPSPLPPTVQQPPVQQTPLPHQAASGAGGAAFAPFWFAVPAQRPLYAEDGSPTRVADLAPGTWYLALEQRGDGLIAQTQDGRRGLLQDTNGIQRG